MAAVIFHTRDRNAFSNHCHPLAKFALLLGTCIILTTAEPPLVFAITLFLLLYSLASRIPASSYLAQGMVFVVLTVFIFISEYFEARTILASTVASLRFFSSVLASLVFIDSTSVDDLSASLGWLFYPILGKRAYVLSSTIQLAISMIPMIADTANTISEARKARGASFIRHPIRSTSELSVGIIRALLDGVDTRADALLARRWDPGARRPSIPFTWRDALPTALLLLMIGGHLWTRGL